MNPVTMQLIASNLCLSKGSVVGVPGGQMFSVCREHSRALLARFPGGAKMLAGTVPCADGPNGLTLDWRGGVRDATAVKNMEP